MTMATPRGRESVVSGHFRKFGLSFLGCFLGGKCRVSDWCNLLLSCVTLRSVFSLALMFFHSTTGDSEGVTLGNRNKRE